jgi:hypothetical protein
MQAEMEEADAPQQQGVQALHELQQAVYDLSSRGVYQAARWAAEQLSGLDPGLLQQASQAAEANSLQPLRTDWIDRTSQYTLAKQHFEFKVTSCRRPQI